MPRRHVSALKFSPCSVPGLQISGRRLHPGPRRSRLSGRARAIARKQ